MYLIRALEKPAMVSGLTSALLVIPLVAVLLYEVVARYALGAPTKWAFDITYMLMGSIFMLGMSYALLIRQHVNVDLIYGRLPLRGRAIVDFLCYGALFPILIWMTYYVCQDAWESYRSGEVSGVSAWNPVVWPFRTMWAIGFGLLSLQIFVEALKAIATLVNSHKPGERS